MNYKKPYIFPFLNSNYTFKLIFWGFVLLFFASSTFSQTKRITGNVRDEFGIGLPGVIVYASDSDSYRTTTILDGYFTIEVPKNVNVLVFKYDGYENSRIQFCELSHIDIKLIPAQPNTLFEMIEWPNYNLYASVIGGSNYLPFGTGIGYKRFFDRFGQSMDVTMDATLRTNLKSNNYFNFNYSLNRLNYRNGTFNLINNYRYYNLSHKGYNYLINNYNIVFEIFKNNKHYSLLTGIGFQSYNSVKDYNDIGLLEGFSYFNKGNTIRLNSEYFSSDNFLIKIEFSKYSKKYKLLNFTIGFSYEKIRTLEEMSFSLRYRIFQRRIMTI